MKTIKKQFIWAVHITAIFASVAFLCILVDKAFCARISCGLGYFVMLVGLKKYGVSPVVKDTLFHKIASYGLLATSAVFMTAVSPLYSLMFAVLKQNEKDVEKAETNEDGE